MDDRERQWRVSGYSGSGADCVAVAFGTRVGARDSKNPRGDAPGFPTSSWPAFGRALTR
ncbi:DUF397 domain-containing protein [Saccharothrix longispora]|uniref:DUF397 domain-containing protein n=1 Tax=Saccharothrix longispora TaxID=33920 RepID=UPI0028FDA51E|nr:DUF397 domain-containing protein [Saccharothrix longispora]MBY8852050.1 DUF397 domain-containing protein [Saccharothrix sp. MB29]MDU0288119.1 DUF397 domain-containing protein [Saccharothrix longispora]